MQKINIMSVLAAHLDTFREDSGKLLKIDMFVFYVIPLAVACVLVFFKWQVPEKALELSISVFSIFAALLLSVQVALYSVSLRDISPPDDNKKLKSFEELKKIRKTLIRELNNNISYLILLSVFTVTVTLLLFFMSAPRLYGSAIAVALYTHFFLTLIMVIKRASIVFSREYEGADIKH